MATVGYAQIQAALATLFDDDIANQINRAVVLGQILDVKPGNAKNVTWAVRTGTATPTTAQINDGVDVSAFNNDTKAPAALEYGVYHDAFALTGKAAAAARAAGNPRELAMLFTDELGDSVERLSRALADASYNDDGGTDEIHGLYGTVEALGDTGVYAGVDRSSVLQWQGNVIDALTGDISFTLLRRSRRETYTASGERIDCYVTDPIQHEKIGLLYQAERRYVDEIRVRGNVIKLDGGYQVLEFDGIPIIEDEQHPVGKISGINTRHVRWWQLPDSPDAMNRALGRIGLSGTPEEQFGDSRMKLTARIQPLAITGDAFKFALYSYVQLQVRRCNATVQIKNLGS